MIGNVRTSLAACRDAEGHSFVYNRPARLAEAQGAGSPCEDASVLRCEVQYCAAVIVAACRTSNPDRCGPCSLAYEDRVRRVAHSGAKIVKPGQTILLTLTAPSHLPTPHLYRGRACPCWVRNAGPVKLDEWNGAEAKNWNRFMTYLRRMFGDRLEYFSGVEAQKRGALHRHVIVRGDFACLVIDDRMRAEIRAVAIQWGYGHEVDWQVLEAGQSAARYVTKYVTKASAARSVVPWVRDVRPGTVAHRKAVERGAPLVSFRPTYRLWTCSRFWGDRMAEIVAWQKHHARCVAVLPAWADPDGVGLLTPGPAWASLVPDWRDLADMAT